MRVDTVQYRVVGCMHMGAHCDRNLFEQCGMIEH